MLTYRDFMFLKTAEACSGLTVQEEILGTKMRILEWRPETSVLSLWAYSVGPDNRRPVAEVTFPTNTVLVVKEEPC